MLVDRNIEPCCAYCRFGTALGKGEVVCIRRGIMESSGSCNAFRYEPTKREPEGAPNATATNLSETDFEI